MRAADLGPGVVEALQRVAVAVLPRRAVAQRRELERDHPVGVRERERVGLVDRLAQRRCRANGDRLVRQQEVGEHHRRDVRVVPHRGRIEREQAMHTAQQQLTAAGPITTTVVLRQRQPIGRVVGLECFAVPVELRQPAAGGDPQIPCGRIGGVAILQDRHDPIARQAVALTIVGEGAARRVETVEPAAKRADPEHPGAVHVEGPDAVIAETGRVLRVVLVARDVSGGRLQAIEPTTQRADPDAAVLILSDGPDPIAAQALGVGRGRSGRR